MTSRIELDPKILTGSPCPDCGQPYGWAHLGTCQHSTINGGPGIVGFRKANP